MSADEPITNLSDAVAAMGALPVPVGPEPQALRPIAYAAKNTDLLLADAAERRRAAEWPWDMWCRICHTRPTSHRTEAEALEAADRHVKLEHAPQAEVHQLMTAGGLAEFERLAVRVAELEAERHSTNEALDDAVQELRARQTGPALPWAHAMSDDDLHEFLGDLVSAAMGRWRSEPEVPDRTVLADIEKVCADWRTPGHGYRSDPEPEPAPDAVTRVFVPVASLREPEGEFYPTVHHSYLKGRDLDMPETGGV